MNWRKRPLLALGGIIGFGSILASSSLLTAEASSHREAPLITEDPVADNTDTYAFIAPNAPDKVTLIANWIPLEDPAGGPNFHRFGDDVLYAFEIDNNGDAVADIEYQFRFHTTVKNADTWLYNTGPITPVLNSLLKATDFNNLNVQQSYSITRVKNGVSKTIASNLLVAPANIGPRSTPDYENGIARSVIYSAGGGRNVFAGPRDDPFFVDLGSVFDLGGLRPLNPAHLLPLPAAPGRDGLKAFNTHTIALQVPISEVTAGDPTIGVWSATYRRMSRVFQGGDGANLVHSGDWVQVSRLGMPLVNEVVIPLGQKDQFNATEPSGDGAFAGSVVDPELGHLIPALYPGAFSCFPTAPRDDLVTIFLTGIPGLNQPAGIVGSEQIRLNTSIAPTPFASQNRLGLLSGQLDGFPNGRRLVDDVTDIELQAVAGATPLGACNGVSPNNALTDGVDANDKPFKPTFPYLASPHQGYDHSHD
jgi:hypothetical protein